MDRRRVVKIWQEIEKKNIYIYIKSTDISAFSNSLLYRYITV
jgi:hypothetical protein